MIIRFSRCWPSAVLVFKIAKFYWLGPDGRHASLCKISTGRSFADKLWFINCSTWQSSAILHFQILTFHCPRSAGPLCISIPNFAKIVQTFFEIFFPFSAFKVTAGRHLDFRNCEIFIDWSRYLAVCVFEACKSPRSLKCWVTEDVELIALPVQACR